MWQYLLTKQKHFPRIVCLQRPTDNMLLCVFPLTSLTKKHKRHINIHNNVERSCTDFIRKQLEGLTWPYDHNQHYESLYVFIVCVCVCQGHDNLAGLMNVTSQLGSYYYFQQSAVCQTLDFKKVITHNYNFYMSHTNNNTKLLTYTTLPWFDL